MAGTSKTQSEMEMGLPVVKIRLVREENLMQDRYIKTSDDAVEAMIDELKDCDREVFCILNLHTNGAVINMNVVTQGTLNASLISPRELFKSSILSNAAGVIMLHNHPSGSIHPSQEDFEATNRMLECGKILDIPVIDHIIVGGRTGNSYSFKANGVLGVSYEEADRFERYDDWER